MTTTRLSLDVTDLRDKANTLDRFSNPEVSLTMLGTEIMIELCRIPVDQQSEIDQLNCRISSLSYQLRDCPSQTDVDFWRERAFKAEKAIALAQAEKLITPEIFALVRPHFGGGNGNKINAVKAIRETTKLGLKEAKDLTDLAWARLADELVDKLIPLPATA